MIVAFRAVWLGLFLAIVRSATCASLYQESFNSLTPPSPFPSNWLFGLTAPGAGTLDNDGVGGSVGASISGDENHFFVQNWSVTAIDKSIALLDASLTPSDLQLSIDMKGTATVGTVAFSPTITVTLYQQPPSSGATWTAQLTQSLTSTYQTYGGSLSGFVQNGTYDPANGALSLSIFLQSEQPFASEFAHFDNIQLDVVPEPTSIVLAALGFVGLLGICLKRRI